MGWGEVARESCVRPAGNTRQACAWRAAEPGVRARYWSSIMRCTMFRKEETPMLRRTLSGIAIGSLASIAVYAQDLPKTQFKVIGLNSPTVASIVDEVPFWRETFPRASHGAISADISP